jgi:hypothetical protein
MLRSLPAKYPSLPPVGLLCERGLPGVKCGVIRPAHENGEAVARGIFGEVFVGDGGVFFEPLLGRELFECCGEPGVDLAPGLLETGGGDRIGEGAIWIGDIDLIELRVQALAESEHGKHAIVDRGEMANQVEQTIFPRSNLFLKLLVAEWRDGVIQTADDELPRMKRGVGQHIFCCHFDLCFPANGTLLFSFDVHRKMPDAKLVEIAVFWETQIYAAAAGRCLVARVVRMRMRAENNVRSTCWRGMSSRAATRSAS